MSKIKLFKKVLKTIIIRIMLCAYISYFIILKYANY